MSNTSTRGRPFDPQKQQQQKAKLLDAAQMLLSEKSFREITVRELAKRAEINSAMISYYFGNKEGLFLALLDQLSEKYFVNLKQIASQEQPIKLFIQFMLQMFSENSGFARLVHDELSAENSQIAEAFIERFPRRMANVLPMLIKANTAINDDKKAKYAAFSLMTMIVMPFVGRAVRDKAWNISDDEIQSSDWAEHIYSMFMFGCGAKLSQL